MIEMLEAVFLGEAHLLKKTCFWLTHYPESGTQKICNENDAVSRTWFSEGDWIIKIRGVKIECGLQNFSFTRTNNLAE